MLHASFTSHDSMVMSTKTEPSSAADLRDIPFGRLPPSFLRLSPRSHPAALIILLPASIFPKLKLPSSAKHVSVNNRHAEVVSSDSLPDSAPIALLSSCLHVIAKRPLLIHCAASKRASAVTVAPLRPLPTGAAQLLARLAYRALRGRDAERGDILPVAPNLWVRVESADAGIVDPDSNITVHLAPVMCDVPRPLTEWALHAVGWHERPQWSTRDTCVRLKRASDAAVIVAVVGAVPDLVVVMRDFAVGSFVRWPGLGRKAVVDALAKVELAGGGFVVVPAGGVEEKAAIELVTRAAPFHYIRLPKLPVARVLVLSEELGDAENEAEAIVHVPRARRKERRQLLQADTAAIGREGEEGIPALSELTRMSAGFAREHVHGLGKEYAEKGIEGCRRAMKFFGATVSVDTGEVGWRDIGGLDQAKEQILDLVEVRGSEDDDKDGENNFISVEDEFEKEDETDGLLKDGVNRRVGVLLYGPPGTGKTLLARAISTECGCSFISVKGPELFDMYVGQSEKNVRDVFRRAMEASPCVIFFDEVDALAPTRGGVSDSGGVADRVVSQLFAELDEVAVSPDIFVIAASNRPDLVDSGLLRPGRLDKTVYVPMPVSRAEQAVILKAQTRNFCLDTDVNLEEALVHAPPPPTLSGADLYGMASRAWMKAAKLTVANEGRKGGANKNSKVGLVAKEIRDAKEWSFNLERIYGEWFCEEAKYGQEYPVQALLQSEKRVESLVCVGQQDLIAAAEELTTSLSSEQLQESEELCKRMEGD